MIIAIDGPAGSGKSTIAKLLSKKLNFEYLDTGALYRGVTYLLKKYNIAVEEEEKVKEVIKKNAFSFQKGHLLIGEISVEKEIRKNIISKNVSLVAGTSYIRDILTDLERKIGHESGNIIMDGRDIGTVVFPDADIKIFLTASSNVRAVRRHKELLEKGENHSFEEITEDIVRRDKLDSTRKVAPLKKSPDAIEVDTDNCSVDEVVAIILDVIKEKTV